MTFEEFSDFWWRRKRHERAIAEWERAEFSIHSYIANYPSSAQSPSQDKPPCAGMGGLETARNQPSLQHREVRND
jgi:hypothetical protein